MLCANELYNVLRRNCYCKKYDIGKIKENDIDGLWSTYKMILSKVGEKTTPSQLPYSIKPLLTY